MNYGDTFPNVRTNIVYEKKCIKPNVSRSGIMFSYAKNSKFKTWIKA